MGPVLLKEAHLVTRGMAGIALPLLSAAAINAVLVVNHRPGRHISY